VYRVLLRHLTPRHPPCALVALHMCYGEIVFSRATYIFTTSSVSQFLYALFNVLVGLVSLPADVPNIITPFPYVKAEFCGRGG
jgi:ABC-type anion transport system duplicated permease subunit